MIFLGRYGVAETFYFPLIAAGAQNFQAAATLAAGDALVSTDGGATGNADNIPTIAPAAGKQVKWIASAAEMTGKVCTLVMTDVAGAEWEDQMITVYTYGHASAHIPLDLSALITVAADVTLISGDATAADNLEATYDGTGYADPEAPSTQSQLDQIANVGAAINAAASSNVLTTGTEDANTYLVTEALDGVYHTLGDTAGTLDNYYQFEIGGDGVPVSFKWTGILQGGNDDVDLEAWDWVSSTWKQIGTINGTNQATVQVVTGDMFTTYVGTGANIGLVRVRQNGTGLTSASLQTDQLLVSYSVVNRSVGYANGSIWVDTVDGTAGTTSFVHGTADNPVLTWADALTLSTSLGLTRFEILSGSTITLTGASDDFCFRGQAYSVALNGQSIDGAFFFGANVSGIGTASGNHPVFEDCPINNVTLPPSIMRRCFLAATITTGSAGDWFLNHCVSRVAGTGTPTFDFGAAIGTTNLNMRLYSGGIEFENMGQAGTDTTSLEGFGQYILNVNCVGGTLVIRGIFDKTDNSGDAVTLVETSRISRSVIADSVWDDTASSHVVAGSMGELQNGAADAVWDELLAGHTVSGSAGEALGNIDVLVGSANIQIRVKDDSALLLEGVRIAIYDSAGTSYKGSVITDANGLSPTFGREVGAHSATPVLAGYTGIPQAITVTGDGILDITMTSNIPAPATSPSGCVVSATLWDGEMQPIAGETVTFLPKVPQKISGGILHNLPAITKTSSAGGLITAELARDRIYEVHRPSAGLREEFTVPDAATYDISELIS